MIRSRGCAGLTAFAVAATAAQAQEGDTVEEPLWEVGVGAFAVNAPDYPASGNRSTNGLPVPIVIYRGDILRVGEDDAVRVVPVEDDLFELSLSAGASFPASSDGNPVREGMPDLDFLFELGPELIVHGPTVMTESRGNGKLELALQVRAVLSADFEDGDFQQRGYVFEPELRYRHRGLLGEGTAFSASIGPIFATEELHDYFYEVEPRFATADRPAFDAEGGYLGTRAGAGLSFDLTDRFTLFGGVGIGVYTGAVNRDSTLFEEDVTASVFAGFTYTFYKSARTVTRPR
ncbi:MAG: MipA/OmpV family protein [Pseudomonadota bacterium]